MAVLVNITDDPAETETPDDNDFTPQPGSQPPPLRPDLADPSQGPQFTPDHVQFPYLEYVVVTKYFWDEGLLQIPVGEAPSTDTKTAGATDRVSCEMARVCAPWGRKEVSFRSVRVGAFPEIPSPQEYAGANEKLLSAEVQTIVPVLRHLGDRHFCCRGVYVFAVVKPIWFEDGLPSGATPYDTTKEATNKYPGSMFSRKVTPGATPPEDLQKRPI